jgi:hypothetical protein
VRTKLEALDAQAAQLPGDQVAGEASSDLEQRGNLATWQPEEATLQSGNSAMQRLPDIPAAESDEPPPQPGNPATLRSQGKAAVLEQWLTKVSRREPSGA